ncbi:MAG: AEC family transporter [Desulfobacterales bacterium]|nr:AEC family transporter [Desulfobacterales bacterium]
MNIVATIIPIFGVIMLGWAARRKGFMPDGFLESGNRLVYYLAIPAMVFRAISRVSFHAEFNGVVLLMTMLPILAFFFIARAVGGAGRIRGSELGVFIQASFHGNLGYIGLAVAFYYLGEAGLARTGILAGFIMILQNFLAVLALQLYSDKKPEKGNLAAIIRKILANPVILSALAGILFSVGEVKTPIVVNRTLDILSAMALPLALLIIGASLSLALIRSQIRTVLQSSLLKLVFLPGLGVLLFRAAGLGPAEYLPGLILLASPTATIVYVMAREMGGDPDFAVAAVSASTLLSAVTFTLWLIVAG